KTGDFDRFEKRVREPLGKFMERNKSSQGRVFPGIAECEPVDFGTRGPHLRETDEEEFQDILRFDRAVLLAKASVAVGGREILNEISGSEAAVRAFEILRKSFHGVSEPIQKTEATLE